MTRVITEVACLVAALGLGLAGCGGGGSTTANATLATSEPPPAGQVGHAAAASSATGPTDWTRFGYNGARTNAAPSGLSADAVGGLVRRQVALDGTVDSSPIYLSGVNVSGQQRNLLVVTTTYGRTLGLNPVTGATLWSYTPRAYASLAGTAQITTATPVADPGRRFVYTASPNGRIHKLKVSNGAEVHSDGWPTRITKDPTHEKIASALNVSGSDVLATTGGYIGDAPPYQGKVVAIDRVTGRIAHVWNSLCSSRMTIFDPTSCSAQRSAIWGRAGAVVDPVTHKIYVTTGNGPFNGSTNWGDSVLRLAPEAKSLERHYTPTNHQELDATDSDLGSTSPALLPAPGGDAQARFLLQGGKDTNLRLLRLPSSLHGVTGDAGQQLGGQVQMLRTPGAAEMFTAPAVLHRAGSTRVFVATGGGTTAYRLRDGLLHVIWSKGAPGTSPVIAGSMLWVYDPNGALRVYRAGSGTLVRRLPAPPGHWNSPIVVNGRVYLPSGDANDHSTSGLISIYRPG